MKLTSQAFEAANIPDLRHNVHQLSVPFVTQLPTGNRLEREDIEANFMQSHVQESYATTGRFANLTFREPLPFFATFLP